MTQKQITILIVDDEDDIRLLIRGLLEDEGYDVLEASSSDQAYRIFETERPDLVIQDIWLQGSENDGIEVLKNVKEVRPNLPFIMISGHGSIETAVSAIKLGAYDFIEKPFKSDRLILMIQRALETAALKRENAELKLRNSDSMVELSQYIPTTLRAMLDKAAKSNSRLFITGEAGSGKNIAAQYVHAHSNRSEKPFMTFNCASPDTEKLEAEFFGVNGSTPGLLELADNGTILLDEVLCLPIEIQGKILMLLQEGGYHKIGSNQKIAVDVRIIATSSGNIKAAIETGRFREDLYYRLNVVPMHMPPLRERKQDIAELVSHYTNISFSDQAIAKLQSHPWPGNIKQLHNVLEWIAIMKDSNLKMVDIENLPPDLNGQARNTANDDNGLEESLSLFVDDISHMSLREAREQFERYYLISQIEKYDGNISKTAHSIGMERSALHRKLKSLNIFSDEKQNVA